MEERIKNLNKEVKELIEYMNSEVQVPIPIGSVTRKLIQKDLLVATGNTENGQPFDLSIEVVIDGVTYWLSAKEN